MARKNPYIGEPQPALFGGFEKQWVPLDEVPKAELKKLPFDAFSDEELEQLPDDVLRNFARDDFTDEQFAELDDGVREYIHGHDPVSAARISHMADFFVGNIQWLSDEDHLLNEAGEYFEMWVSEHHSPYDRPLWTRTGEEGEDFHEGYVAQGYPEEEVTKALDEALSRTENLQFEVHNEDWRRPCSSDVLYVYQADHVQFYIDSHSANNEGIFDDIHDDEIEAAIVIIEDATDHRISLDDIVGLRDDQYGHIEFGVDTGKVVCIEPIWDNVREDVEDELEDVDLVDKALEDDRSEEERILPVELEGGFYVQELSPSELKEESRRLGHCVGKAEYGFGRKIARGVSKILSMRSPAGKSKLTFEVSTQRDGTPKSVPQIYGKANRLPSKPMEVRNAMKVVEFLGLDPHRDAPTLRNALTAGTYTRNPKWNPAWHCGFCKRPA